MNIRLSSSCQLYIVLGIFYCLLLLCLALRVIHPIGGVWRQDFYFSPSGLVASNLALRPLVEINFLEIRLAGDPSSLTCFTFP